MFRRLSLLLISALCSSQLVFPQLPSQQPKPSVQPAPGANSLPFSTSGATPGSKPVSPAGAMPETTTPGAPPEVDKALRARATQFLQFTVDANYRKAYELVAEDSKDYYFGLPRPKVLKFSIVGVEYSENFTKAVVRSTMTRIMSVQRDSFQMDAPAVDNWVLENGMWMWAKPVAKVIETPFGTFPVPTNSPAPTAAATALPDTSPEGIKKLAEGLKAPVAQGTKLDKERIIFKMGEASSQEVTFHNGGAGSVHVIASVIAAPGLVEVSPKDAMVAGGQDLKVKLTYNPARQPEPKDAAYPLRFTVDPFNSRYFAAVAIVADPAKYQAAPDSNKPK